MPDATVTAADGGAFSAYLARPPSGKGPGLVVLQEIFGINRNIRAVCDRYAAEGYFAIAPDLFWRIEPGVAIDGSSPEEFNRALALMQKFDREKGVADIQATLAHVRKLGGCTGKAGALGFCLGGSLAYATACFTDADCCVGYYPVQVEGMLNQAGRVTKPVLLHMAEKDEFCPPEAQKKIFAALIGIILFSIYRYKDVGHGFARPDGPHYDKAAAELADRRTAEFLKENLQ